MTDQRRYLTVELTQDAMGYNVEELIQAIELFHGVRKVTQGSELVEGLRHAQHEIACLRYQHCDATPDLPEHPCLAAGHTVETCPNRY